MNENVWSTPTSDFVPLPYINLIVTTNTPPNLNQLTTDRLKLMTLFPVRNESGKMFNLFLLPVFVKISVRIWKGFTNTLEYCFTVIPESSGFYTDKYNHFPWFMNLVENITLFEEFQLTLEYDRQKYESRMVSKWILSTPYNLQSDVLLVC